MNVDKQIGKPPALETPKSQPKPSATAPREQKPIQTASTQARANAGIGQGAQDQRRSKTSRLRDGNGATATTNSPQQVSSGYSLSQPNKLLATPEEDHFNLQRIRT
jgi:hypothetical protein